MVDRRLSQAIRGQRKPNPPTIRCAKLSGSNDAAAKQNPIQKRRIGPLLEAVDRAGSINSCHACAGSEMTIEKIDGFGFVVPKLVKSEPCWINEFEVQ